MIFFSNKTFRRVFCSPGCRNQFLAGNAGTNNELRRVQELPGKVFWAQKPKVFVQGLKG